MMYVFGIDMPIMEILFVVMLAMLGALVLMISEIHRLKMLLLLEKSDIYRFEGDIAGLEKSAKKKHTKSLNEFVKGALDKGMTKSQIYSVLGSKGWPKTMISDAYANAAKKTEAKK